MLVMLQVFSDLSAAVGRDRLQMFALAVFISWRHLYPFVGLASELSAVKSDLKNCSDDIHLVRQSGLEENVSIQLKKYLWYDHGSQN
jgi:hypothetical protein